MAKHYIRASKPRAKKPTAEIRATPSWYEKTHPVGSAERFLDEAAREALDMAASGSLPTPSQSMFNAGLAVAKEYGKYPDSVLAEAAKLPKEELAKRAARAAAYQNAMEAQNRATELMAAITSPVGNMTTTMAAAGAAEALDTQQATKGGNAFDPDKDRLKVPEGREKEYEEYMDSLANLDTSTHKNYLVPKDWRTNTEYNKDYDFVAAFLADKAQPVKSDDGYWHMDDIGKMPNHPTFSNESYYARDPKWAPYAGRWEGEKFIPPEVRQAAKGGDAGSETAVSETPVSGAPQNPTGPRIVINPQVFEDKRDALCVAFNEAFRVVMEDNGFEPVSEPTEKQRQFFADTAYANDELQLRRTILARIATLDTSVSDPTDEQLEETVEMLEMVMEVGAPQNEWEQQAVQRLHDVVAKALESTRANGTARQPEPPKDEASTQEPLTPRP